MNSKKGNIIKEEMQGDVWFVYDGECTICKMAAQMLQIKNTVGNLHLVNAREERGHDVINEINALNLNLDDGMVLKFQGLYYHGQDALHMMALLGSPQGCFNRMNAILFRSKAVAKYCYPLMRSVRNLLLRLKGVTKIDNLQKTANEPIFKAVFGKNWDNLPQVLQKHYAVRPYSEDVVRVQGVLDVHVSKLVSFIARITGMLLPYSGDKIPVAVTFRSGKNSRDFYFDRIFHFPKHGDVTFRSHMRHIKDNILVEFMRFGIGWKLGYIWDGEKVILQHKGYVWRIFGVLIPIPASFIIGKGYAEEMALSDDTFSMWTHAKHPLFGKTFAYAGEFKIVEVSCGKE